MGKLHLQFLTVNNFQVKSIDTKGPISEDVQRYRQKLEEHYKMWEEEAFKAFNRDLSTLAAQRSHMNMEPYLRCIPTRDFVTIIIEEAKKMAQGSETYSPTVYMLYRALGSRVYARYLTLRKQKLGFWIKSLIFMEDIAHSMLHYTPNLTYFPGGKLKLIPVRCGNGQNTAL